MLAAVRVWPEELAVLGEPTKRRQIIDEAEWEHLLPENLEAYVVKKALLAALR